MTEKREPSPTKASPSGGKTGRAEEERTEPKVIKPPRTPPRPTPR